MSSSLHVPRLQNDHNVCLMFPYVLTISTPCSSGDGWLLPFSCATFASCPRFASTACGIRDAKQGHGFTTQSYQPGQTWLEKGHHFHLQCPFRTSWSMGSAGWSESEARLERHWFVLTDLSWLIKQDTATWFSLNCECIAWLVLNVLTQTSTISRTLIIRSCGKVNSSRRHAILTLMISLKILHPTEEVCHSGRRWLWEGEPTREGCLGKVDWPGSPEAVPRTGGSCCVTKPCSRNLTWAMVPYAWIEQTANLFEWILIVFKGHNKFCLKSLGQH